MKQEYKITFMKGYNWCIPDGYTIYNALDENDLRDFISFCDNITDKEDALYEISLISIDKDESHNGWIKLISTNNDSKYLVVNHDAYKKNEYLDFTLLCKECNINPSKYMYVKSTLLPEESKEKHPPIVEGAIYSLGFKYQNNRWYVDTPPFKETELSYFATIWDLFAVIAKDKKSFTLDIICTMRREVHEGWIELYENSGFTYHLDVHGLKDYNSENHIFLSSQVIDAIGFYPKYIYLKKRTKW